MNRGQPPDNGHIFDRDMTGEGPVVGHHAMIADNAIVGDMRIGHEEIVVADNCFAVWARTGIGRYVFPENVICTDMQRDIVVAFKFFVLGNTSDDRPREKLAIFADGCVALNHAKTSYGDMLINGDALLDNGIRADGDMLPELGLRMDDGCFVNAHLSGFVEYIYKITALKETFLTKDNPLRQKKMSYRLRQQRRPPPLPGHGSAQFSIYCASLPLPGKADRRG